MAANTAIEWADHTFNPWIGCTRISAACDNCYAADMSHRYGWARFEAGAPRHLTSAAYWRQPMRWHRAAIANGVRPKVFCASLADVFDVEVTVWRHALFDLIAATTQLDWLVLTKRPHLAGKFFAEWGPCPRNVWLGTTVENQAMADLRIPQLLAIDAAKHFVSIEPMLGPIDLAPYLTRHDDGACPVSDPSCTSGEGECHDACERPEALSWVIAGGESGRKARPSHPAWFRALRDQCAMAGVPFFFKQWGEWHPAADHDPETCPYESTHAIHIDGDREFRPLEAFMTAHRNGWVGVCQVGKKRAGALLDGREHREFPT